MKSVSTILFMFCILYEVDAQKEIDSLKNRINQEFNMSLSFGRSFLGPMEDMKSAMIEYGYDDTAPGLFGFGPTSHPQTYRGIVYDFEATWYFKNRFGVSFNGGRADIAEVDGFDEQGGAFLGDFLFLESRIVSVSLSGVYRSANKRHSFFLGPALIKQELRDATGSEGTYMKVNKPGVYVGYTWQLVMTRYFSAGLKANYRWASNTEIGPFTNELGEVGFPATTVKTSALNIALTAILRLNSTN
jgi:hypothetical protein